MLFIFLLFSIVIYLKINLNKLDSGGLFKFVIILAIYMYYSNYCVH